MYVGRLLFIYIAYVLIQTLFNIIRKKKLLKKRNGASTRTLVLHWHDTRVLILHTKYQREMVGIDHDVARYQRGDGDVSYKTYAVLFIGTGRGCGREQAKSPQHRDEYLHIGMIRACARIKFVRNIICNY